MGDATVNMAIWNPGGLYHAGSAPSRARRTNTHLKGQKKDEI